MFPGDHEYSVHVLLSLSPPSWLSLFIFPAPHSFMGNDPPVIRCPACGSILTAPLGIRGMWECRYHLCRVIFPVSHIRERGQVSIAAEEEPPYRWEPTKG
jgi:hypothetical protein